MKKSAVNGFTNATDAADYLVKHGVPFRDAYSIIGQLVLYCLKEDKAIDELSVICFQTVHRTVRIRQS